MPPNPALELATVSLIGQNKIAVVVGATAGIGAAIARLLAKLGCSRVYIVGRNAARGQAMVDILKKLAPLPSATHAEFIQGDVEAVKGMRATAEAIQLTVGSGALDYLVLCQHGMPSGQLEPLTTDGLCPDLAVQCISRFALAYLLTKNGALAPGATVLSIAGTGQSVDDLDVEDLSFAQRVGTAGKRSTEFFWLQSARDSTVLDAFHQELTIRYPQYRYVHMAPGLVSSEKFNYDTFPGYTKWLVWIGMKATGQTPDEFAPTPVYILAGPNATEALGSTNRYFTHKLAPVVLGKWASDKGNRQRCWNKLCEIIGETYEEA
ncbi:hypothetical protein FB45DRAFT_1053438 [Roridomyces roridus]|uniref:NAD(P)-binding protein n=1 Tax=Roridomyces roridus TaxID=1738132 RepID=A0AAD7CC58_9AGAR|nr:hypothetical protein FB45DRAFT_1053438 [Roridomyces roridus]